MKKDESDEKIWEEVNERIKNSPSPIPKRVNIKLPDGKILKDDDPKEIKEDDK